MSLYHILKGLPLLPTLFLFWRLSVKRVLMIFISNNKFWNSAVATGLEKVFSFQSQRKVMTKNAQTTTQLHSSYTLVTAAAAKSLQSCPTLCDPIDGSPPSSPIPGTLQVRTLEWVAISFSSAWTWKVKVKSLSRVRLRDPLNCSLPDSSVHGIFQARYWSGVQLPSPHMVVK